ncbi:hypothetical protein A3Q56_06843 [Intoshia linei]|uniref:Tektin n=1 Tax=Intoshia linei TaxID=1819745 RepID=A0A177AUD5_9BILA|nr:hypothetical protein A3Q56_06843 [Intoshia linei]
MIDIIDRLRNIKELIIDSLNRDCIDFRKMRCTNFDDKLPEIPRNIPLFKLQSFPFIRSTSFSNFTSNRQGFGLELYQNTIPKNILQKTDFKSEFISLPYNNVCIQNRPNVYEWFDHNAKNINTAERVKSASEKIIQETKSICRFTEEEINERQNVTRKHLSCRLKSLNFWKNEITREVNLLCDDSYNLTLQLQKLKQFIRYTHNILKITTECRIQRKKRKSVDLINDTVQELLEKEVEICQEWTRKLSDVVTDMENKLKYITIEEWESEVNNSILNSQSERAASSDLCINCQSMINKCASIIIHHWNQVNTEFSMRTKQVIDIKNKTQHYLNQIVSKITKLSTNIECIKCALLQKDFPLRLAKVRLSLRKRRPNGELCNDNVNFGLREELNYLMESKKKLQDKLDYSIKILNELIISKKELQKDIIIKNHSIFIDREKCMTLRGTFSLKPMLESYY